MPGLGQGPGYPVLLRVFWIPDQIRNDGKRIFLVSLNDVDREAQPFKAGSFTIRYFLSIIYHLFTLFTTASPEFQGVIFMSKRSPGMATRAHIIKNASHPICFAM